MSNNDDDDDDLKQFEKKEDRKWSNLQRIQQRMAERQQKRKPPRQTEFKKKKKLKNIENPEWKKKYEQDRKAKEKEIKEKYDEEMKRKKKFEKEKKQKQDKILKKKWEKEAKINKSGLKEKPPDIRKWNKNFAKQQMETQKKINEKYELKKQKDRISRQEFKKKAAEIEKKYDDKKPKKKKRDPNKKIIIIDNEHNAFTAVENNNLDLLNRIFTFYPNDIKRKDKQGNTILHHTIKHFNKKLNNNSYLIEYLIPKLPISYINTVNFLGNTPMTLAVYDRKFECMKALYSCKNKKKRPNLNHMNINGRTVLMHAAMRDDIEIIEFLLNCIPPPNLDIFSDKVHKTALTYAVEHNKSKSTKILIENGANFYIKNKLGKTARDIAENGSIKILKHIIKQERVNVVKGCIKSTLIINLNVPDYIITIISQYVAQISQEIIEREQKEKQEQEAKKKKKAKRRGRGRGRGRRART